MTEQLPDESVPAASKGNVTPPGEVVLSWRQQLEDMFVWLQRMWLPVTALVFFASVMLLHGYISRLGLLVGFSAVEVLTVMPFAFCLAVFFVCAAALVMSLPLLVFLTPPRAGEASLVARLLGMQPESEARLKFSNQMIWGWALVWMASGIVFYLFLPLITWLDLSGYRVSLIVTLPVAITSLAIACFYVSILRGGKWRVSFDYGMNMLLSVTAQCGAFLLIFAWVFRELAGKNIGGWGFLLWASISIAMLFWVAFLQVVMAVLLTKYGKQQNLFKIGGGLAMAIVLIVSTIPGAGGRLLEKMLSGSISGARSCAQLAWYPESAPDFSMLLLRPDDAVSQPVRILAEIGGTLQVRPLTGESDAVYLVPVSSLVSVMGCEKEATSSPETADRE